MRTLAVFIAVAVLSLALLTSCSDDEAAQNTEPEYSRATPEELIAALAYALEEEQILIYDECLHDEYQFEFLPQDADDAGLPPEAPWWGKTQDVSAVSGVFSDPMVKNIESEICVDAGPWTLPEGVGYRLDPSMEFTISRESVPEDTTLYVGNSYLYVEIARDPYDDDLWVFKTIEERLKEGLSASSVLDSHSSSTPYTTLGSMKARYAK
ncbi:MAG: hypothetical protein PVF95_06935 [bacterium]|jgi:hypothetical protein